MLSHITKIILVWLEKLIATIGYPGIMVAIIIENIFPPIPSEVIMFGAGIAVNKGLFNLWLVAFVASLGALFAGYLFYYLGLYGGRSFLLRYGKHVRITEGDILYTETWFKKYGPIIILFGRFIPIVRTLVSFPAGIARINVITFSLYTFIGSFCWLFLLTYLGFAFGEYQESILDLLDRYEKIVIFVFLLLAMIGSYFFYKKKFQGNSIEKK